MKIIPGISQFLDPLQETVQNNFIPAIILGHIYNNNEQNFFFSPNLLRWVSYPSIPWTLKLNLKTGIGTYTVNNSIQYG